MHVRWNKTPQPLYSSRAFRRRLQPSWRHKVGISCRSCGMLTTTFALLKIESMWKSCRKEITTGITNNVVWTNQGELLVWTHLQIQTLSQVHHQFWKQWQYDERVCTCSIIIDTYWSSLSSTSLPLLSSWLIARLILEWKCECSYYHNMII